MSGDETYDSGMFDVVDLALPDDERYQALKAEIGAGRESGKNVPTGGAHVPLPPTSSAGVVLQASGVSQEEDEYFMGNSVRGIALIFNHTIFDIPYAHPRRGTEIDEFALRRTFLGLGFHVRSYMDLSFQEIRNILRQVAAKDHTSSDCIVVAVLTYGGGSGTLCARDREYHISELVRPFAPSHCPTLTGKPKLFFIQANRTDGGSDNYGLEDGSTYGDVLISYSTYAGTCSFRSTPQGGWYVQTLCNQLEVHGRTKDLVSLLTDVNRIVSEQFRSQVPFAPHLDGRVQQPCFTSALKRQLRFR